MPYPALSVPDYLQPYESSVPSIAGAQPTAISGNIGSLPGISALSQGINAINLGYQAGAIPNYTALTGNVSDAASRLLNPADAQANYDVSMQGAESAVGRGVPGSGAAAETTGRLRQSDIERRALLGNQLLSSQVQRLPAPFNPASQLLTPGQLSQQDTSLLHELIARGHGSSPVQTPGISYPQMTGGGGRVGPVVSDVGRASVPPQTFQPLSLPTDDSGLAPVGSAAINPFDYGQMLPENWLSMTPDERDQYLQGLQGASAVDPSIYGEVSNPLDPLGQALPSPDYGGLSPDQYEMSFAPSGTDYYAE